jgi:mannose-6-phosphate isomerase-like protein (cupin superfamily)
MKNRREFLQAATCGLFGPLITSMPQLNSARNQNKKGVVRQPEDGETYYVRENTPITIQVSKKTDDLDSISICTEEILPGNGIPVHKHLNEDEFFIFQKGAGIIDLNGEEFPVKAGTMGFVPRATWHSIKNTSPQLLIFTFGYSPSGFEDFFRKIGTPKGTTFKAKTTEEIKRIAEKYGMVYK